MFDFFKKKRVKKENSNNPVDKKKTTPTKYTLIDNELYIDFNAHNLTLPENKDVPDPIKNLPANHCYSYLSVGLGQYNKQEVMFVLSTAADQNLEAYQADIFKLFRFIYNQAKAGNTVSAGSYTTFLENGPFGVDNCGLAYLEPVTDDSIEPKMPANTLLAVYIHPEEIDNMVASSPYRVAAWLAYSYRIFPYPKFSDPARKSVLPRGLPATVLQGIQKLIAVKEATVCLEGAALFLTIPPPIRNTLRDNLDAIKQDRVFSIITGHVAGANSRLVWLPGTDEPQAVGAPVDGQSRLEGGFVTFVGNQPVDKAILTEDGFGIFLCDETWEQLCSIIEGGPNTFLRFKENTAVISIIYIEFYDDGPYIGKRPDSGTIEKTVKDVLNTGIASENPAGFIKNKIKEIDATLSKQLNLIIHHQDFQGLERSWKGLSYLVANSNTNEVLKIRALNISKKELWKTLRRNKGTLDQSSLFLRLHDGVFGAFGGEPYGCLIGDYYFDHQPKDIESLELFSQIGAAIHAPFIAGASPSLFGCEKWDELFNPHSKPSPDNHPGWAYLRKKKTSRFIALTMPRFLGRSLYEEAGSKTGFNFIEYIDTTDPEQFCWINSAYAMGVNINKSFNSYGWFARIRGVESGGTVENLPTHIFPASDGGAHDHCSVELAMSDRHEAEFANVGLMPLMQKGNADFCAFIGARSLQKLPESEEVDEYYYSEQLLARLPYLLGACRIVHYLKCINRDKLGVGAVKEAGYVEAQLNEWLARYTESDWDSPLFNTPEKPLAAGSVTLSNQAFGDNAELTVLPNYQLEGMQVPVKIQFYLYEN